MTPEEKFESVRSQMLEMWRKHQAADIDCPYCLKVLPNGEESCCGTLQRAVDVIIEWKQMQDKLAFANRVLEQSKLVQ